jgi:prepilin-type N-terminal cleavage/methylation domain-containing protein
VKKAFTIVEVIIAMGLLGIIMVAVSALFNVGVKNYRTESQKALMQKEINFVADDIGVQIKQAAKVPESFDVYNRTASSLILALPAVDIDENFIYSGGNLAYDHYIYSLSGGNLTKKIVTDANSNRQDRETTVLNNVTEFNCTYLPDVDTEQVTCIITTAVTVRGNVISFTAEKTARLRNFQ